MRDRDRRRPFLAHQLGQRARIDAGDPDPAPFAHPVGKALVRAIIARLGHHLAHQAAERMRLARLDVLVVGADIADVREGEGDDLLRVGWVGHHLLVAGHGGVEAQLADRLALGAEALAPHRPAIGEHHDSGRALRLGRVQRSCVGHGRKEPSVRGLPAMSLRRCRYALCRPGQRWSARKSHR